MKLYGFIMVAALIPPAALTNASPSEIDYNLSSSFKVVSTSESGDRMTTKDDIIFTGSKSAGLRIIVRPDLLRQEIDGIGSSFTESSAFVLSHLSPRKRMELMERLYGEGDGRAGFVLTRTHIGSCDFSVEGNYSYREHEDAVFSIENDAAGFPDEEKYQGVRDRGYDLLPMIKEALGINPDIRIIASAWTAPPWMKDIGEYYIKGHTDEKGAWHDGTGGRLLERNYRTYAEYIRNYIDFYAGEGVSIWGVTPVNEPNGNGGNWESMQWAPHEQAIFVRDHLGPVLEGAGVRILAYDQNRGDDLREWADGIYADKKTAGYIYGMAVHWYSSTIDSRTGSLEYTYAKAPGKTIIHTEGCIDNLGLDAPGGIADPEGYRESGWWKNDGFWWNESATDWGYTAQWGDWLDPADHPAYTPVHRYARDIIESLNHRVNGWIDWNVVLDRIGGPNHVGNFCGAPIMIDIEAEDPDEEIYFTPVFYALAQFSSNIRPGDRVVESHLCPNTSGLYVLATISGNDVLSVHLLNTAKEPRSLCLEIGVDYAPFTMEANSILTIKVRLAG